MKHFCLNNFGFNDTRIKNKLIYDHGNEISTGVVPSNILHYSLDLVRRGSA